MQLLNCTVAFTLRIYSTFFTGSIFFKSISPKNIQINAITNEVINKVAVQLYTKIGFQKDSDYENHIITMFKPLNDDTYISKWQGIPLGFDPEVPI